VRKYLLLASTFATLALAASLPASAADTPITFTLTAGALSISAPSASVPLGSSQVASPSAHTFSGLLGTVTVTDDRGGTHAWVASVISTAFTGDAGQTAVAAVNVAYAPGAIAVSGVVATTPVTTNLTGVSPVVNGTSTGLAWASWNPTVTVVVPAGAAAGTYSATITHSVA
jgi:hypothetical protein